MNRSDGRELEALRPIEIELGPQRGPAGSALIRWGHTHVLCAATFEDRVPAHRQNGGGWLTAEYSMLPGSSHDRIRRERAHVSGRTAEIQRLIGRSLRAVVDLDNLGPRTLWLDCDVLQADGGTRCASITGAWVAAAVALLRTGTRLSKLPPPVAAVSLGVLGAHVLVDLAYDEDSKADVDLNFVACPKGIVEIQGTAEGRTFDQAQLTRMTELGHAACQGLFAIQQRVVEAAAGALR